MKAVSTSRAFSLMEILAAIAILVLLASVIFASINILLVKLRDAQRVTDIKQIQVALSEYATASNSQYPTTLSKLVPDFLAVVPVDPVTKDFYRYAALGTGASCFSYHLGTNLEDVGNGNLNSDSDASVSRRCTGSSVDFIGGGVTSCGGSEGTDQCFDVKP